MNQNQNQMSEAERAAKLEKLISDLAQDLRPEVERIEKGIKTTQNNYGHYMALISTVSKGNKGLAKLLSLALVRAGANPQGVASAMQFV